MLIRCSITRSASANWVIGNHDTSRVGSRFGYNASRADQMSMLAAVLPGMMVIYNGDEIGMVDRPMSWAETVDPAGCNAGPERYRGKSRDPERTPYQWDGTRSAGFSSNLTTWLPVHENYRSLNLELQKRPGPLTHFRLFQRLAELRTTTLLREAQLEVSASKDAKVLGLVRRLPHRSPLALLLNLDDEPVRLDLRAWMHLPDALCVFAASVGSGLEIGASRNTANFVLPASATVILAGKDLS